MSYRRKKYGDLIFTADVFSAFALAFEAFSYRLIISMTWTKSIFSSNPTTILSAKVIDFRGY